MSGEQYYIVHANDLSDQIHQRNQEIVKSIFNDERWNHCEGYKFNELPGKAQARSSDVADAIRDNPDHTLGKIQEPLEYLNKNDAIQKFFEFLAQQKIELNEILADNENVPGEIIKDLFPVVRAFLEMELALNQSQYYDSFYSYCQGLESDQNIVREGKKRAEFKYQGAISTLQSWMKKYYIQQDLRLTTVIGDLDCLYHSTTANLLYKILDDSFYEESPLAMSIRTNLLPLIEKKAKIARVNIPSCHNVNAGVKNIIIQLMRAYSNSDTDDIMALVSQCNFAALSTQIFVPALKELVYHCGTNPNIKCYFQPILNEVMREEFIKFANHVRDNHELPHDALCTSFKEGEFDFMSKEAHLLLLKPWLAILKNKKYNVQNDAREQFDKDFINDLNDLYDEFMASEENGKAFYQNYFTIHNQEIINRSAVQIAVLSISLSANFILIDEATGKLTMYLQNYIEKRIWQMSIGMNVPFFIRNPAGHFSAYVGELGKPLPKLANVFSERFSQTHDDPKQIKRNQKPRMLDQGASSSSSTRSDPSVAPAMASASSSSHQGYSGEGDDYRGPLSSVLESPFKPFADYWARKVNATITVKSGEKNIDYHSLAEATKEDLQQHEAAKREFKQQLNNAKSVSDVAKLLEEAEPCINRHRNVKWDKFIGKQHTDSWREAMDAARSKAFILLDMAASVRCTAGDKRTLYTQWRNHPIFAEHRKESFFVGAWGRTSTQAKIDEKLKSYDSAMKKK